MLVFDEGIDRLLGFREVTMLYVDRWIECIEQSRSLAQDIAANSWKSSGCLL